MSGSYAGTLRKRWGRFSLADGQTVTVLVFAAWQRRNRAGDAVVYWRIVVRGIGGVIVGWIVETCVVWVPRIVRATPAWVAWITHAPFRLITNEISGQVKPDGTKASTFASSRQTIGAGPSPMSNHLQ